MTDWRSRLNMHAEKVKKQEEMEAALAGVFSHEAEAAREKFTALVHEVIKPTFNEFKTVLREAGRDAVIVTHLTHAPLQSIGLTLRDRHLSFGPGKTLKLVNPKEHLSNDPNAKYYEIFRSEEIINIRQRVDPKFAPTITQVGYSDISRKFLEDDLAAFFERAYPTPL